MSIVSGKTVKKLQAKAAQKKAAKLGVPSGTVPAVPSSLGSAIPTLGYIAPAASSTGLQVDTVPALPAVGGDVGIFDTLGGIVQQAGDLAGQVQGAYEQINPKKKGKATAVATTAAPAESGTNWTPMIIIGAAGVALFLILKRK